MKSYLIIIIHPFCDITAHIVETFHIGTKATNIGGYCIAIIVVCDGKREKTQRAFIRVISDGTGWWVEAIFPRKYDSVALSINLGGPSPFGLSGESITVGLPIKACDFSILNLVEAW